MADGGQQMADSRSGGGGANTYRAAHFALIAAVDHRL